MDTNGPNWTALGALIVSVLALSRTILSDQRSKRVERLTRASSRFESEFGEPVRESLRAFEKSLRTLRTFMFPGAKTPAEMKSEIYSLSAEWEDAAGEVDRLLREMDGARLVSGTNWASTFRAYTERAELSLQSIAIAQDMDFGLIHDHATRAYEAYQESVRSVRAMLDTQKSAYEDDRSPGIVIHALREVFWPE